VLTVSCKHKHFTVSFQVKNISVPIYQRLKDIQKDHNKHFFTFCNEFCRYVVNKNVVLIFGFAGEIYSICSLDPQAGTVSCIRRRIFVRRKSAEKNSASRIRRQIFAAENPPKKFR